MGGVGGVLCDYDSAYHCQLEINTFTFIFMSLSLFFVAELIFKCWESGLLPTHTV